MDYFASPLTIKALNEAGTFEGLASDAGVDLDGEIVTPGAFAKSLSDHKAAGTVPALLLHHDLRRPAGRWTEIIDTPKGLAVKGKLTLDAPDGSEAYALLRDGALSGLSVGFTTVKAANTGQGVRTITEAKLWEVSLVSVPANPRARVSTVKAITGARDIEELLREAGLSSRRAKAAAGGAWRALNETEDDESVAKLAAILDASNKQIATYHRS